MKKVVLFIVLAAAPAAAQVAMPDPTQMAGMAIPAPELPDGTVSVRLVREALGNNIIGHDVTVTAGEARRTAKTDETGRAQMAGLPAGATAVAEAVVDGERLTSKPFEVPARGGIRVILVAGLEQLIDRRQQEADAAAKAPPVKGIVVLGGDSRLIFEFQDDTLQAFYLLDVLNNARARVDIGGPLLIDLPRGAGGATLLQGSTPQASVSGDRVTITGPFAPGITTVRVAFRVLYTGDRATIEQTFPVAMEQFNVVAEKVGELHMMSPQFASHGDVRAEDGTPFILGRGGRLQAGAPLTIELTNLPSHSTWPLTLAFTLAGLIVVVGAWLAFSASRVDDERRRLVARRAGLYGELVRLEEQHRAGRIDPARYGAKRRQLIAELERVLGELDSAGDTAAA